MVREYESGVKLMKFCDEVTVLMRGLIYYVQ
jgi:hypothetical protein